MKKKFEQMPYIMFLLFLFIPIISYAELERVGPVQANNGYPAWYQDKTGLVLEFGAPLNQAELDGGWCLILPADVPSGTAPETFPADFAEEHFYWAADAGINFTRPQGLTGRARLVLGLEGAFAIGPVIAGDQITFGRLRVDIRGLPFSGTYTIYTPYAVLTFPNQQAGDRLFYTEDIGLNAPAGTFDGALLSRIGPFLLPAAAPGGDELPPITGPVPGKLYIADPARLGPVTGSPLPPFTSTVDGVTRNHNIFRVEGPNGFVIETTDFALMGRVFTATIPGKITINRASYSRSAADIKLDVFATAFPVTQGRLPGSPRQPAVIPILSFFNAPPDIDPNTGALLPPAGLSANQMFGVGSTYWGQSHPATVPSGITLEDETARDATGQVVPVFMGAPVTDEVTITEALYDPANGGSLSLKAQSSDLVNPPVLTVSGMGDMSAGQLIVSPLAAPPYKVSVLSSAGGLNELQVTTLSGIAGGGNVPVAVNDDVTINEDTSVTIDVLLNDTLNGAPIPAGTGVVTIVGAPRLGTAIINADQTIFYTPNPNVNGTEGIGYTVTVNGVTSSAAYVSIVITPVNDPPSAVNDTAAGVVRVPLTIDVLANDTDPDGQADLATAVIVTPPQPGASVTGGPAATFTASAAGTYTFTYRAQDAAGAASANAATVTVTVAPGEIISVQQALFRITADRWIVSGTDNVPANQTLAIAYDNGVLTNGTSAAGTAIGTAVVDVTGNWLLDIRGVTGILDPTNISLFRTLPTRLRITSAFGTRVTAGITIRF